MPVIAVTPAAYPLLISAPLTSLLLPQPARSGQLGKTQHTHNHSTNHRGHSLPQCHIPTPFIPEQGTWKSICARTCELGWLTKRVSGCAMWSLQSHRSWSSFYPWKALKPRGLKPNRYHLFRHSKPWCHSFSNSSKDAFPSNSSTPYTIQRCRQTGSTSKTSKCTLIVSCSDSLQPLQRTTRLTPSPGEFDHLYLHICFSWISAMPRWRMDLGDTGPGQRGKLGQGGTQHCHPQRILRPLLPHSQRLPHLRMTQLSRPRLVGRNGTQDNNKNGTRRQELELPGDLEYKMPKTDIEPEWFNND